MNSINFDVAMPVVAWIYDWQQGENSSIDWITQRESDACTAGSHNVRPLVRLADAQAALAALTDERDALKAEVILKAEYVRTTSNAHEAAKTPAAPTTLKESNMNDTNNTTPFATPEAEIAALHRNRHAREDVISGLRDEVESQTAEIALLTDERDALRKESEASSKVKVTPQGVSFGNCFFSHERITGYDAERLNNGDCGIIGREYMKWVQSSLAATDAATTKDTK